MVREASAGGGFVCFSLFLSGGCSSTLPMQMPLIARTAVYCMYAKPSKEPILLFPSFEGELIPCHVCALASASYTSNPNSPL